MVIWKFSLKLTTVQEITMPSGARILSVQTQFNEPEMWAMVEPEAEKELRTFEIFGTGKVIPDLDKGIRIYIGTFQVDDGNYVYHLFELKN